MAKMKLTVKVEAPDVAGLAEGAWHALKTLLRVDGSARLELPWGAGYQEGRKFSVNYGVERVPDRETSAVRLYSDQGQSAICPVHSTFDPAAHATDCTCESWGPEGGDGF